MFERFTEGAKRSLFVARHNAFLDGSRLIEGHHLLHALLAEKDATVRELLAPLGVSADRVRALLAPIPPTAVDPRTREIPFSEAVKQVLTFGAEEADTQNHVAIGPGHLLLGLLRVEGAAAGGPLTQSGVHIDAVRIAIREGV
jgi:ATP-dependent Clp protease ATP-binding subunit ClpA